MASNDLLTFDGFNESNERYKETSKVLDRMQKGLEE
jgi:hypothetical protein